MSSGCDLIDSIAFNPNQGAMFWTDLTKRAKIFRECIRYYCQRCSGDQRASLEALLNAEEPAIENYNEFIKPVCEILGSDQATYLIEQSRALFERKRLDLPIDFSTLEPDQEANKFVVDYAQVLIEEMKQLDLALCGWSDFTANEPTPCNVGLGSIDYTLPNQVGRRSSQQQSEAVVLSHHVRSQTIQWKWLSRLMGAVGWVAVSVLNYLLRTPESPKFHPDGPYVLEFSQHGGILESRGSFATVHGLMDKSMVMTALRAAAGICRRLDERLAAVCDEAEEQFAHGTLGLVRSMRLRRHDMQLTQHADGLEAVLDVLSQNEAPEQATWGQPPTQLTLGQFLEQPQQYQ